jgi:2-(3-amino-3-carboxypropyl)histidine synthase
MYDLELDRVTNEIIKQDAKRVLLQLPDGLRQYAVKMVTYLQKHTGANIYLSGDSCYGSCDIATIQAKELGADLLVHYGHSNMIQNELNIPILYVHSKIDVDLKALTEVVIPKIKNWKKIGLVTTIQHIHQLNDLAIALKAKGFKLYIGTSTKKTSFNGQILGCSFENAKSIMNHVDGYLYLGGGQFHPMGLILSTGKPVVIANPYTLSVSEISKDGLMNFAKKRMAKITITQNAHTIGILSSSKPGQANLSTAEDLRERFEQKGYQAAILFLDEVRAEHLNNFTEFEAFINTACPRIALDGITEINKPILSINEAKIVLQELKWEDLWGKNYI